MCLKFKLLEELLSSVDMMPLTISAFFVFNFDFKADTPEIAKDFDLFCFYLLVFFNSIEVFSLIDSLFCFYKM